ncbi:OmpA family protein [Aliiroseovarius sp. S253]|uniref:OmpA family protein n=1 Tax=Aliiroseovarius sp. S253 TaxID=3415133 RepID=UPI003C7E0C1E
MMNLKVMILMVLMMGGAAFSQSATEIFAGGGGTAPASPTQGPVAINLLNNPNNPSGNTASAISALTPTATLRVLNQQFANSSNFVSNGIMIGGTFPGDPHVAPLSLFGGAQSGHFTSLPIVAPGTGINVSANHAFLLEAQTNGMRVNGAPTNGRNYFADLQLDFNTPVSNVVVHVAGLGGVAGGKNFSAELDLVPGASIGVTGASLLSSNGQLSVSGSSINAATPSNGGSSGTSCSAGANGAACGSVRITGDAVTRVYFRVYMESPDSVAWPSNGAEGWFLSVSGETSDMTPAFSSMPASIDKGTTYTGLTLTCTNNGPNFARNASCAPTASAGTISSLSCSPTPLADISELSGSNEIECTFDYLLPIANTATSVAFTGQTGAINDRNGGAVGSAANNQTITSISVNVPTPIVANDDTPASVNGATGATLPNVVANDTLNGVTDPEIGTDVALTPGTAPSPAAGSITMNTDGTITVAAGTTAGTYSYPYTICEVLNPANCDTATATVVVDPAPIVANDDTPASVNGVTGGSTASVLDNDTLNGVTVDPADITLTSTGTASDGTTALGLDTIPTDGSITMNAAGEIIVSAGTTAGTYLYTYEICEDLNPANCDTAVAMIVVDDVDLLSLIRKDLETILEDDLAATLNQQSKQMSSYAAGALDRLRSRTGQACLADVNAKLTEEDILFDTDKAIIKPESDRILDEIAEILGTCEGSAFEIAGHTDSDASDAYNLRLSQRRVEAVLRALAERGVDTTGYIARGYGERQPIASNATAAGKAKNRRVEFRPLEEAQYQPVCSDSPDAIRKLDVTQNEFGMRIDGSLRHETYDCRSDAWSIVEGSLSHLETDQGQSQSMVNLSYRRERFTDEDSVRGYFIGLYGTRNEITNLATGEIEGFGINGGIYGADRLRNGLFLDYYLGAAAGKHKFNLDFERDIGTINAEGDYQYFAVFAGAALSGEMKFGNRTVTPRFGFDFAYAPGADVSVVSSLGAVSQSDVFELGEVSGGRLFLEVRDEYLINNNQTLLALTPRIACYHSFGLEERGCGIGGSIELSNADEESDLIYSLKLDGERGSGYSSWQVKASIAKRLRNGVLLSGEANVDNEGRLGVEGAIKLNF